MNKKYIDFVPANKKAEAPRAQVVMPKKQPESEAAVVTRTTITRTTVTGVSTPAPSSARTAQIPTARSKMVRPAPRPAQAPQVRPKRPTPVEPQIVTPVAKKMPTDKVPPMGVVEDLNARFVKKDVPKRPLSTKPNRTASTPAFSAEIAAAKQQKVKARSITKQAKKSAKEPVKEPIKKPENKEKATYKTPKSPFINQHKVKKRPLSGNIYKHEIKEAVKEEPKGPVTIIAKPEKDKHIGIIVTIIITIILGAAAGTVAFLLLPK